MKIEHARMTHQHNGELVVFLIGMRVNKPWRLDAWLPSFMAMPRMLKELAQDPESGFLGHNLTFGKDGPTVVQYWNSVDKLYAYASRQDAEHRPAWARFNRLARKAAGAVGIWHETYRVDRAETLYVAMPEFGLAKASQRIAVTSRLDRAKDRIARDAH